MNRLAITLMILTIALGAPVAFAQEDAADQEVAPATPAPPDHQNVARYGSSYLSE